jgi:hypothetical protein
MVHRVWQASGLKPHLVKTFKVSRDKKFVEKVTEVVGLYLNPPEHALVLCADEKTSVQALDHAQPGLPLVRGRLGTMPHDYKRNGTTLFAARGAHHCNVALEPRFDLGMLMGGVIVPRFHQHFVPTSSSWLNMVERWFRDLTDKQFDAEFLNRSPT